MHTFCSAAGTGTRCLTFAITGKHTIHILQELQGDIRHHATDCAPKQPPCMLKVLPTQPPELQCGLHELT